MVSTLTQLLSKKTGIAIGAAVVTLAVIAATLGFVARGEAVTLSVDGEGSEIQTSADTVGELLKQEDIEIGQRDVVAPDVDHQIDEGDKISVRFARPLELNVDGDVSEHWVLSTDVDSALREIGKNYEKSDLSVSRSAEIGRDGLALEVVQPRKVTIKVGAQKARKVSVAAETVREALKDLDIKFGEHDHINRRAKLELTDGLRIVIDRVHFKERSFDGETIEFDTTKKNDDSMYEGESKLVRDGVNGKRDVTYRIKFVNGEPAGRTVLKQNVLKQPVAEIVRVGTKEQAASYSGSGVWGALAQCESGGNPGAVNPAGPYYGLYQFTQGTWNSVGGSGVPTNASPAEQTKRAKILQARSGWGQWPACSSKLGLR